MHLFSQTHFASYEVVGWLVDLLGEKKSHLCTSSALIERCNDDDNIENDFVSNECISIERSFALSSANPLFARFHINRKTRKFKSLIEVVL